MSLILPKVARALTLGASLPVAALHGCASSHTLPRDLPSMQAIYAQHASTTSDDVRRDSTRVLRPIVSGPSALKGYTRTAWNEIDQLFAELPNPAIVLYIDPHLSQAGYPVPGYTTALPLYPSTEYARPGEVPPPSLSTDVAEVSW